MLSFQLFLDFQENLKSMKINTFVLILIKSCQHDFNRNHVAWVDLEITRDLMSSCPLLISLRKSIDLQDSKSSEI